MTLRKTAAALLAALACSAALNAAETCGKFVQYDTAKKELTVDVNGAKSRFTLTEGVKVVTAHGDPALRGLEYFSNPKVAKPGAPLTVVTTPRDGKEVVTEIKLGGKLK